MRRASSTVKAPSSRKTSQETASRSFATAGTSSLAELADEGVAVLEPLGRDRVGEEGRDDRHLRPERVRELVDEPEEAQLRSRR